ncbi:MAG TPA: TolC family protein [Cyclobacteriaceae bacterium]|nr:TolC family protein [Cyclobacteriaceae bacterium]
MMTNKLLALTLFILLAISVRAQQADSTLSTNGWTLKQCIDYAWANNLTVQRSMYAVETSEVDLKQAKLSRLPTVNASGSYGYSWGRGLDPVSNNFVTQEIRSSGLGANGSLPVFNGMRINNSIKQYKTANEAAELDLQKSRNDVALSVANFFITVVFNKELVENAKYQLASSQQQLDRTVKQVQAGALPLSEQLNLEAQVATNELNLIQQDNALSLSMLQLKQALQIPDGQPFDVIVPDLNPQDLILDSSRDEIFEIAREAMPEIKSSKLKVESSYYAVKASRGNLYPRLSLVGTLNTNYSSVAESEFYPDGTTRFSQTPTGYVNQDVGAPVYAVIPNGSFQDTYGFQDQFKDNIYRTVSLQVTIPIFNGFTSRANLQRSLIQSEVAKINEKEVSNTLRQNVETSYNQALASSKSYSATLRQVNAREEAFRMIKQRYEIGAANFVDYQISENDLFRAKSDLLRAKYDFIFKKKVLDFYQNKPIEF